MNKQHCHYCVFKECGDSGYGSRCNIEQDAFLTKPCLTPRNTTISTWSCKYFTTMENAIEMINEKRGYNV